MQASQVDWVVRDFEPAISTSVKAKVFLMLAVCVLSHLGISFEQKKKKKLHIQLQAAFYQKWK